MLFIANNIEKIKKNKLVIAILFFIILSGIFLRAYHFSSWLHFEIDQTYDTKIVSQAVENGPGSLPLLGPTAGGGRALRLGPAYYYLEYLSAFFFGNTPTGHAFLVLIFSILALLLFFFFCRLYFRRDISLVLTAIFSISSYLVFYSRFAWSPNVLPLLVLTSFFALLKSVSENEVRKGAWFLGAVFFMAITSQIHFNAFFTIPTVVFFFLVIKRPHFNWKIWLAALGIIAVVYSPVIISDIKTGGQNLHYFLEKMPFYSKGDSELEVKDKNLGEKLVQDFRYNAGSYLLILSGIDNLTASHLTGGSLELTCESCEGVSVPTILSYILFATSFVVVLFNLKVEHDERRKNFLLLLLLWLVFSCLCFFSVLYDGLYIYPRFFLVVAPLAIVYFGLILEKLHYPQKKITYPILILIVLALAYPNLTRIKNSFTQLAQAESKQVKIQVEDVFPDNTRVTLEQQEAIVNYVAAKYQENGFPVYIKTIHEFEPVYWYLLRKKGIDYYDAFLPDKAYAEGNYFYIEQAAPLNSKKKLGDLPATYDEIQEQAFGMMTVHYLQPKPEIIIASRQNPAEKKIPIEDFQISELLTWNKLFLTAAK